MEPLVLRQVIMAYCYCLFIGPVLNILLLGSKLVMADGFNTPLSQTKEFGESPNLFKKLQEHVVSRCNNKQKLMTTFEAGQLEAKLYLLVKLKGNYMDTLVNVIKYPPPIFKQTFHSYQIKNNSFPFRANF